MHHLSTTPDIAKARFFGGSLSRRPKNRSYISETSPLMPTLHTWVNIHNALCTQPMSSCFLLFIYIFSVSTHFPFHNVHLACFPSFFLFLRLRHGRYRINFATPARLLIGINDCYAEGKGFGTATFGVSLYHTAVKKWCRNV